MTVSSIVKINTGHFKEWITVILSVIKTDALLQGMNDCNQGGEINKMTLQKSNA